MQDKRLETIPVGSIDLSRFNTRRTRPEADIAFLAQRILRNGFEVTRAPWVYPIGERFEVFAGGTRVEAAKRAGLAEIPAFVHEDFAWDDIARLADEDNENDEYHRPVPIVDVWAECHRLAEEESWRHERIALAKGWLLKDSEPDRTLVVKRISAHTKLVKDALKAVWDGLFDEGHVFALLGLVWDIPHLAPWITSDQAQSELVDEVLGKHRGSSKGFKPTVDVVRKTVQRWKVLIDAAKDAYQSLDTDGSDWRQAFVNELVKSKARTVAAVEQAKAKVLRSKQTAIDEQRRKLDEEASKAELEQQRIARITALVSRISHGDSRTLIHSTPLGFHLLLTDPPYGVNYQSGRRTTTARKATITNDQRNEALALLRDVLAGAFPRMADDSTVLVFTGWRYEPEFRQVIADTGFTIKGSLVWVKHNHGTGDLAGSFAPRHERIIHAVKGSPKLAKRYDDVLYGKDTQNSDHPTEKPRDLLRSLIEATTSPDQIVVDPFAGSGNTLYEAHQLGRNFHGMELDDEWHRKIVDQLRALATQEMEGGDHAGRMAG